MESDVLAGERIHTSNSLSTYQRVIAIMLPLLQFAVVVDFTILSPLGAIVIPALSMTPAQFGIAVSAYSLSAGMSGIVMAGHADNFDRKRLLLFFYTGFLLCTAACALATSFETLVVARFLTGIFGGVVGSTAMAIVADIFEPSKRGRVMGLMQGAFSVSQVLGLPIGLQLATSWGWQAPFLALAIFGAIGGLIITWKMKPLVKHLDSKKSRRAYMHLWMTVSNRRYYTAFSATALLTTGGFMLMPFISDFLVNNAAVDISRLSAVYLFTGISSLIVAPFIGRLCDRFGAAHVLYGGCCVTFISVLTYTRTGPSSLAYVIAMNIVLFVGISARMIPWQALLSGIPSIEERGSFHAIGVAIQHLAGSLATVLAGNIVRIDAHGRIENFTTVGHLIAGTTVFAALVIRKIEKSSAISGSLK